MSKDQSIYETIFKWAYRIGMTIKERDEKLLRRLIFAIRGEETPGRFLDKLSEVLSEYKTNVNLQIDVDLNPVLFSRKWHGDSFHYMRSAVLTGLLNSLASEG